MISNEYFFALQLGVILPISGIVGRAMTEKPGYRHGVRFRGEVCALKGRNFGACYADFFETTKALSALRLTCYADFF